MKLNYPKAKIAESINSVELVSDLETDATFFRALEKRGIKLNRNQITAVRHKDNPALVVAIAGSGKCVKGDTLINTDKGLIKIEDIPKYYEVGAKYENSCEANVISYDIYGNRNINKTSHWFDMGISKTIKVKTRSGYEIEGTLEHPMLILNKSGDLEYKHLINVIEGEHMVVSLNNNIWSKYDYVSEETAYLMGLFIADGYLKDKGGTLKFSNSEQPLIDWFKNELENNRNIKVGSIKKLIGNCEDHSIHNIKLKKELESLGMKLETAAFKDIPWSVLMSSKKIAIKFLQAMFDTESNVNDANIELTSASIDMIRQIQILLLNFGVRSSNNIKMAKGYEQPYYRLTISGIAMRIFKDEIGYYINDKYKEKLELICQKKVNTNVEVIPNQNSRLKLIRNTYYTRRKFWNGKKQGFRDDVSMNSYLNGSRSPSAERLKHFLSMADGNDRDVKFLNNLADNFFFDPIHSICHSESRVYDFTVPDTHSFVANGLVSHNTAVLTARCGHLISVSNVDPSRILLLTFTNKAAKNMKIRLVGLPSITQKVADQITAGTFHTVCKSFLIERGDKREIWSSSRGKEITIKIILRNLGIDKKYRAEDVISLISSSKNNMISVEDYPDKTPYEQEFKSIFLKYEEYKRINNLMDFDDMLLDCYKLFMDNPEFLKKIQDRYDYVMGDESQDVNNLQYTLLRMLSTPKNNLFIVADDDQVIFSFNGANSSNILNFKIMYPDATIITLDINYRSSDNVVGLSGAIIKHNKKRMDKITQSVKPNDIEPEFLHHETVEEEASYIVEQIKLLVNGGVRKYGDFAILHRSGVNARSIFEELLLKKVPFISYGSSDTFYEGYIIEPLLAYLKLSYKPKDLKAIEKVLPTLYLGKDKMKNINSREFMNPIGKPLEHVLDDVKPFQRTKIVDRIRMIDRIKDYRPMIAINYLRDEYEEFLIGAESVTNTSLHKEIVKETIDELIGSSKRFNTNQEFIEFVEMVIKNSRIQKEMQKNEESDSVRLMTIHKSKGLEFPHVFGIGCSDGSIPHSSSLVECSDIITEHDDDPLEEERRLLYVMTSRSETWLTLSASKTNNKGKPVEISRFLKPFLIEVS